MLPSWRRRRRILPWPVQAARVGGGDEEESERHLVVKVPTEDNAFNNVVSMTRHYEDIAYQRSL